MGVTCGYLGAAPSLIWAVSVLTLPLAPLLLPVYVWLYTLVEVFAALWFAHYMLDALDAHRQAVSVSRAPRVDGETVDAVIVTRSPAGSPAASSTLVPPSQLS